MLPITVFYFTSAFNSSGDSLVNMSTGGACLVKRSCIVSTGSETDGRKSGDCI